MTGLMYSIAALVQPIQYWGVSLSTHGSQLDYIWPWNGILLAALLVMVAMGQALRQIATNPALVRID